MQLKIQVYTNVELVLDYDDCLRIVGESPHWDRIGNWVQKLRTEIHKQKIDMAMIRYPAWPLNMAPPYVEAPSYHGFDELQDHLPCGCPSREYMLDHLMRFKDDASNDDTDYFASMKGRLVHIMHTEVGDGDAAAFSSGHTPDGLPLAVVNNNRLEKVPLEEAERLQPDLSNSEIL